MMQSVTTLYVSTFHADTVQFQGRILNGNKTEAVLRF